MRKGVTIAVTPADRARLQSIIRDRNSPQKHVWRARIVLLTADGAGTTAVVPAVGKGKTVVWRWQERFMPNEGSASASREVQEIAFRAGIDAVLEQLRLRQFECGDEMRYQTHLVAARWQSLIAMNDLIDSIVVMFTPQPSATVEQVDTELT